MKKFFTFIAAALFAGSMFAETAVMQYTAGVTTNMKADENNAVTVGLDDSYFVVTALQGAATNNIGLNKDGSIRLYTEKNSGDGNVLEVGINGGSIQSIVLDIKQNATFSLKAINGTDTVTVAEAEGKYAINAPKFAIKNETQGATTQLQLNKITIEYTLDGSVVGKPIISPEDVSFSGSLEVSIAAVEGAKIYYTLDESEPTIMSDEYTAPFVITTTTVVKAIAEKDGKTSGVAEKKFSVLDTVSVSEARQLIDDKDVAPHYVRGVAAGDPFIFGSAEFKGNIVLWLTDEKNAKDSLEAYYIAGKDNQPWASLIAAKDEIQSGDTVLVYAEKLSYYSANKVYEIEKGYYAAMLGKYKEDPSIKYDTINVAQAIEVADKLDDNATSEKKYVIEGYANHVQAYDALKGNQIFFMYDEGKAEAQDSVFEAYLSSPKKDGKAYPVLEGDKVRAFGFIKKYIDAKNGNAKILEVVEPAVEFLIEVPGDRDIKEPSLDTITVAKALEIGAALEGGKVSEKQYVIGGYVSNIVNYYDADKKTETFWMADSKESAAASNADGAFEVYNGKPTPEEEMGLHARVYVTTKIKKYQPKSGDPIIETDGTPAVNVVEKGVIDIPEVVTVAEALEIGNKLSGISEKRYEITGYVSAIHEAYSSFGNETFYITDKKGERTNDKTKAFYVYRGKPDTKKEIGFDAKIKIICKIKNYNGTIENDGTNVPFEVLEQGTFSIDTITVAEAVEKTQKLPEGSQSMEFYAVKGYIAQISSPYDAGYGNMSFYISDDQFASKSNFQCYRAKVAAADAARAVKGAFVIVTGHLDNNSHGLQMYTGAEVFVGDAPQLDTLTVAKALEIGKALDEGASTDYYAIKGFVASILSDYEEELQSFVMSDDKEATSGEFRAIEAIIDEPGAQLHDEVLLIGKIEKVSNVIRVVKGHATVNPGTGIQNVTVSEKAQKIMIDGVLYIIRDNKIFNVQGTQVR